MIFFDFLFSTQLYCFPLLLWFNRSTGVEALKDKIVSYDFVLLVAIFVLTMRCILA